MKQGNQCRTGLVNILRLHAEPMPRQEKWNRLQAPAFTLKGEDPSRYPRKLSTTITN
jgi:hypothetical protein